MHKFTRAYSITYARIRTRRIVVCKGTKFILVFCKGPTVIGVKLLWCPSLFNAIVVRAFFNYITGGAKAPPAPMVAPPHSTILAPPVKVPFL
jgi:hypothetical protein